jgi:hypothetical protein
MTLRHRFAVNDIVIVPRAWSGGQGQTNVFTVVEPIPSTTDRILYRIKAPGDVFDYVVDEVLLRPADIETTAPTMSHCLLGRYYSFI